MSIEVTLKLILGAQLAILIVIIQATRQDTKMLAGCNKMLALLLELIKRKEVDFK